MDLIQLNIKGISYSQTQTGSYALILEEISGPRKLPIIIGSHEAQSIALALESDLVTKRPVTHDLFVNFSVSFDINLIYVIIYKLEEGVFYSNLYFESSKQEKIIDSRTSDAIALAIRFGAPIYTNKLVLEQAGVILDMNNHQNNQNNDTVEKTKIQTVNVFTEYSTIELEQKLNESLLKEDYEMAALIRDELESRRNKKT